MHIGVCGDGVVVGADGRALNLPEGAVEEPSQLFWFAVAFGALYVLLSRVVLPKIASVQTKRAGTIKSDLDEAAQKSAAAEQARVDMERAVAKARADARAMVEAARADVTAKLAADQEAAETRLAAKIAEAEAKVDAAMQENPELHILVEGYTDSVGSEAYNQRLSERRAESVRTYMVAHGIAPGRIETRGYGETKPVASNDTAEGRARNRRVVIVTE